MASNFGFAVIANGTRKSARISWRRARELARDLSASGLYVRVTIVRYVGPPPDSETAPAWGWTAES